MKIEPRQIKIADLVRNYRDDNEDGVFGYDGKLTVRPAYQREFVYNDAQRRAVIDTVLKGFPLNVMYWSRTGDDAFEVLDGQQRTISIGQYVHGDFPVKIDGNDKFWINLTDSEKQRFNDYSLTVYLCEGTEEEKLAWFRTINIAGETLTPQELLNAAYTGPWLADARHYFSKRNCVALQMGEHYIKGKPLRQEILAKVLKWVADRDHLESGQMYMAVHQCDRDANDLFMYYQQVINWAKLVFPNAVPGNDEPSGIKGLTESQEWGLLYNRWHDDSYNVNDLKRDVQALLADDDVTKKSGIIPYLLSHKDKSEERALSLRAFTESQKHAAYEHQEHKCAMCRRKFSFSEMEGDHIVPWSKGGHTVPDNLQMLCRRCNNDKRDR